MNANTFNRTLLVALTGSMLAFGLSASPAANAQDEPGFVGKAQAALQQDEQPPEARKRGARGQQNDAGQPGGAAGQAPAQAPAAQPAVRAAAYELPGPQEPAAQPRQWDRGSDARVVAAPRGQPELVVAPEPRRQGDSYARERDRGYQEQTSGSQTGPGYPSDQTGPVEAPRPMSGDRYSAGYASGQPGDLRSPPRQDSGDRRASDDRALDNRYPGGRRDGRLPDRERQTLIEQQRRQAAEYSRQMESRRGYAQQQSTLLQRQHRNSQYRYQQQYYERLRQQQMRNDWRNYDYYNDPYFYTAPSYRYYRGGSYYDINRYGADLLRQAINYGYQEGIRAGQADRYDGWRFSYRDSYAYQDANYGYYGYYVNQREYNYYFREGFRRGYEDGYYGRRQYGRYYNGSDAILGTVLSLILNLQSYR